MDHDEAVRQRATERYLLNELDPDLRDQFEEHLFDCQECALDVRSAAMFIEQSKVVLAESPTGSRVRIPVPAPATGWFAWLRPALAVPVLALLLVVIGYQNLVTYPQLKEAANTPQVLPWASINVSTRGSITPIITALAGQGFNLLVSIPPESRYASYRLDLHSPAGRLEWSRTIPAAATDDARALYIPGASRPAGTYTLTIHGMTAGGGSSELGRYPFELAIQK